MVEPVPLLMRSHSRFLRPHIWVAFIPLAGCLALAALFAIPVRAQTVEQVVPQAKQGYVTDLAGVLSASGKEKIVQLCGEVEQKTQAEIAVVTIKSLEGRPIEDYAVDLFAKVGVGAKATNRGVLILLATDDHRDRIEAGYDLESILPDAKNGDFLREATPILRSGDYNAALYLITRRVADVIAADKGVTLTGLVPPTTENGGIPRIPPFLVFVIIFVIFSIIRAVVNATRGGPRRPGGGGSGWWIWPLIFSNMGGGGRGGWGGGGFGGGGGGGGFGGFGGGMSGGGGASGSW